MKKRFRKSIHLKTNHAYVIKLSLGKKTGYAQRRSRGVEAVLCTGPFLEEIEIRKVLQHGGRAQLRLRGRCETGHRRHPVRHGGTVGRRGCDPVGPPG